MHFIFLNREIFWQKSILWDKGHFVTTEIFVVKTKVILSNKSNFCHDKSHFFMTKVIFDTNEPIFKNIILWAVQRFGFNKLDSLCMRWQEVELGGYKFRHRSDDFDWFSKQPLPNHLRWYPRMVSSWGKNSLFFYKLFYYKQQNIAQSAWWAGKSSSNTLVTCLCFRQACMGGRSFHWRDSIRVYNCYKTVILLEYTRMLFYIRVYWKYIRVSILMAYFYNIRLYIRADITAIYAFIVKTYAYIALIACVLCFRYSYIRV